MFFMNWSWPDHLTWLLATVDRLADGKNLTWLTKILSNAWYITFEHSSLRSVGTLFLSWASTISWCVVIARTHAVIIVGTQRKAPLLTCPPSVRPPQIIPRDSPRWSATNRFFCRHPWEWRRVAAQEGGPRPDISKQIQVDSNSHLG